MDVEKIIYDLNNCTDEEFAEVFVGWYKNWTGNPTRVTAEEMRKADVNVIANKIRDILEEVIHSKIVCTSAWWKKKKYRVWTTMKTRCYLDVEADNEDEAWEIAENTDGGEFIEASDPNQPGWELERPILINY